MKKEDIMTEESSCVSGMNNDQKSKCESVDVSSNPNIASYSNAVLRSIEKLEKMLIDEKKIHTLQLEKTKDTMIRQITSNQERKFQGISVEPFDGNQNSASFSKAIQMKIEFVKNSVFKSQES